MRVAKWGNSLAVRLPKDVVDTLALQLGDEVSLTPDGPGRLIVSKDDRRAAALERMRQRVIPLPPGYKFDREEANERK
jgi:antitoxin MazE